MLRYLPTACTALVSLAAFAVCPAVIHASETPVVVPDVEDSLRATDPNLQREQESTRPYAPLGEHEYYLKNYYPDPVRVPALVPDPVPLNPYSAIPPYRFLPPANAVGDIYGYPFYNYSLAPYPYYAGRRAARALYREPGLPPTTYIYDDDTPGVDVDDTVVVQARETTPADVVKMLDEAFEAFRANRYRDALAFAGRVVAYQPQDPRVHQLTAQALMAMGNYRDAAVAAHSAVETGNGKVMDWPTLYRLYDIRATYTGHLRALEKYVVDNPNSADGRFLLGYQYVILGHLLAARNELTEAVKIAPEDRVAQQLLQQLVE